MSRSGAATHVDQHPNIQTQHIVFRGGWTVDGLQTVFNYITGGKKVDSRVGRALSGWTSPDNGAFIPRRQTIPDDEEGLFSNLAANTIVCAAFPRVIREYLFCILVLHYNKVKEEHPESLVLRTIQMRALDFHIDENKLLQWSELFLQNFTVFNAKYIPITRFRQEDLMPATTVIESIRSLEDTTNRTLALCNDFARRHDNMEQQMRILVDLVRANQYQRNAAPRQEDNNYNHVDLMADAPDNVQLVAHVQPVPDIRREILSRNKSKYFIDSFFYDWFNEELYRADVNYNTKLSKLLMEHARLLMRVKRFLPNGTIIPPRPVNPAQVLAWQNDIRNLATHVRTEATRFINQYKNITDAVIKNKALQGRRRRNIPELPPQPAPPTTRKRRLTTTYSVMVKRLNNTPMQYYANPEVIDQATIAQYQLVEPYQEPSSGESSSDEPSDVDEFDNIE